ncbi:hypothetical protein CYMTET_32799 [Cymbomonas tetramitiformis]|uniref:Uncharacterized protein n=1 Tax=Cymbomonas tetramitiformis TaxID=36881 RepID=A0AAE0FE46_9CHLO|nr:hypothetical protein CYMTET_32799 [Cymbomonas tetramitiformis]
MAIGVTREFGEEVAGADGAEAAGREAASGVGSAVGATPAAASVAEEVVGAGGAEADGRLMASGAGVAAGGAEAAARGQVVIKKWLQEGQRLLLGAGGVAAGRAEAAKGGSPIAAEAAVTVASAGAEDTDGTAAAAGGAELGTWLEESLWRPRWEWGRGVRETLWEARGSLRLVLRLWLLREEPLPERATLWKLLWLAREKLWLARQLPCP